MTRNEFERVWKEYPEKKGKEAAWRSIRWQIKNVEDLADLFKAIENYKKDMVFQRKAFPGLRWKHGSTFFGPNQYWRDFIDYESPDAHKPNKEYKKQTDPVDKEMIPKEDLQNLITSFNSKLKGF